ncbi:MAG: aspartate dehydrogenase [Pseudomonadota bacterium]|jgi:aspartate dehydrogenase
MLRVAVAGLGAIGRVVAHRLADGIPGLALTAVAARDPRTARAWLDHAGIACPVLPLDRLPEASDLVVECAPAAVLGEVCRPMLAAGKRVMVLSASALLRHDDLISLAQAHGGQIIVPTGALIGFDAVTAAAEGVIHSVRMVTTKPPAGFAGAPYLIDNGMSLDGLVVARCIFAGSARAAAAAFPANVNVVAALALAGIGPDRTRIEIWADPTITRNCHRIEVTSDAASFTMAIENVPSENPRTGRITAQSVIAALRKLTAPLRVGT